MLREIFTESLPRVIIAILLAEGCLRLFSIPYSFAASAVLMILFLFMIKFLER